jgi:hypothetical protein
MKIIILLLLAMACSTTPKDEDLLLGKEKKFLQSIQKRARLLPVTYEFTQDNAYEQDAILKELIKYYPFADVKIVTAQMNENKIPSTANHIEDHMKAENDSIVEQMLKLIEAFRIIPKEQISKTQEALDRFSLEIRKREQTYKAPLKCFNEKDCQSGQSCLSAGFCANN